MLFKKFSLCTIRESFDVAMSDEPSQASSRTLLNKGIASDN